MGAAGPAQRRPRDPARPGPLARSPAEEGAPV